MDFFAAETLHFNEYLGVAYEPTFASWTNGLKLTLTIDNLFDEKYCDYVTYGRNYWPAAGRSLTIGSGGISAHKSGVLMRISGVD